MPVLKKPAAKKPKLETPATDAAKPKEGEVDAGDSGEVGAEESKKKKKETKATDTYSQPYPYKDTNRWGIKMHKKGGGSKEVCSVTWLQRTLVSMHQSTVCPQTFNFQKGFMSDVCTQVGSKHIPSEKAKEIIVLWMLLNNHRTH